MTPLLPKKNHGSGESNLSCPQRFWPVSCLVREYSKCFKFLIKNLCAPLGAASFVVGDSELRAWRPREQRPIGVLPVQDLCQSRTDQR